MAYSKIILNGETLMDVTNDTVDAGNLLDGETATKNSGVKVTGSLSPVMDVEVDGTSVVTSGVAEVDLTGKADAVHTHTKSQITDFPTIPTITDTYSSTSSNGMSGKAVNSALQTLDGTVSGTAGSGKTLTAFSQTDGKVSATFGNISITKSQVSDFPTIPTNVSELTNDAGYLTSYTETDPTVPSWAKASSKPTYTASEVGALPSTTVIPTITDTYSGTSSDGMSGKAVKSAIDALDGTITGTAGSGKTLTAFSQTDGKVSATFGNISITKSQVSDFPTIPTITDTYSSTSSNGMSGKAVNAALQTLDGTISGSAGSGKTLTAFSQTDGKVSATFGNISITKSQVSDFPTATKTTFTPSRGSSYSAYGGCYYKVYGSVVNLHLSVSGLTSGASANLYTLPTDVRPSGYVGAVMSSGSSSTYASVTVGSDGNVNVIPVSGTYVIGDLTYII